MVWKYLKYLKFIIKSLDWIKPKWYNFSCLVTKQNVLYIFHNKYRMCMAQLTVCCHNKNLWHKHAKFGAAGRWGCRPRHAKYSWKMGQWRRRGGLPVSGAERVGGWRAVVGRDATELFMCTSEHYALTTRCVIGKLTNNLFVWIEGALLA